MEEEWRKVAVEFLVKRYIISKLRLNNLFQQDNNAVGKRYSEDDTINDQNERFDIMKGIAHNN